MMIEKFKKIKSIIPVSVTSTAQSKTVGGLNCHVQCLTGNVWIDPTGTATSNSIKLPANVLFPLVCQSLSLISDGTGGTAQIIIYED